MQPIREVERTGFWSALREMMENGIDEEVAVEQMLDQPEYRPTIIKMLAGIARHNVIRADVRKAERSAHGHLQRKDVVSARKALVAKTFPGADGRLVEWPEATMADHLARAHWNRGRQAAHAENAALHELCAQIIDLAGVKCLKQIKSIDNLPLALDDVPDELRNILAPSAPAPIETAAKPNQHAKSAKRGRKS